MAARCSTLRIAASAGDRSRSLRDHATQVADACSAPGIFQAVSTTYDGCDERLLFYYSDTAGYYARFKANAFLGVRIDDPRAVCQYPEGGLDECALFHIVMSESYGPVDSPLDPNCGTRHDALLCSTDGGLDSGVR